MLRPMTREGRKTEIKKAEMLNAVCRKETLLCAFMQNQEPPESSCLPSQTKTKKKQAAPTPRGYQAFEQTQTVINPR